jgi:alpha-L-rhamnosidase
VRYLQLLVTKGRAEPLHAELRGYEAAIPAPTSGEDPALDKIAHAAWSTLRQNAADLLVDCPSRERAGWLFDSFFSARVAQLLSGSTAFEESFLENYLLCPDPLPHIPAGMFPMCYPDPTPATGHIEVRVCR